LKNLKPLLVLSLVFAAIAAGAIWFKGCLRKDVRIPVQRQAPGGAFVLLKNYGKEIDVAAARYNIPAPYLKALCLLESSGRKPVPSRYEKHVFVRLKLVKAGLRNNYEHVTREHLSEANDEAIQNLASSWGPFQLMGYKCLLLDINVADLRGDNAVDFGARWINQTYGEKLRQGKFKDAFHIHNTGRPFPSSGRPVTHDPNYVKNGLKWMEYFKQHPGI